jgi:hypothetical protein
MDSALDTNRGFLAIGVAGGRRSRASSTDSQPSSKRTAELVTTTKAEARVVVVLRTQLIPYLSRTTSKSDG